MSGPSTTPENMPSAVVHPTSVSEDGNSVALGFTENDPLGPSAAQDGEGKEKELLAGKYKSTEELERAYRELEAKLGAQKAGEQPEEKEKAEGKDSEDIPESAKVAGLENTEEATTLLKEKGMDISVFTREYESTGSLSEESLDTLDKAGITRAMVREYIDGQRVLVESQVRQVKDSIGGEAEYQRLMAWAQVSLSDREKSAYDKVLASNDMELIVMAAQGLKSRYTASMGKDPDIFVGGHAPKGNDGAERFASRAQMVEAMRDTRYQKDPAYRAKVERMVLNSNI